MAWQERGGSLGFCSCLKSWMKIACLRSIDTQYSIIRLGKSIKSVWFFPQGPGNCTEARDQWPTGTGPWIPFYNSRKARGCRLHLAGLQAASGTSQGPTPHSEEWAQVQVAGTSGPSGKCTGNSSGWEGLGLPWNFLWPVGHRPGDQTGMSWEQLWLVSNGTSGALVNVQTRAEV